jgi:protoporphyrinogen oxidase
LGNNKIKNRRNTKILFKGRYIKYPFENGLSDLPRDDNFECLYNFIQNLIRKEKGEISSPKNLRGWFYYTFGGGIAEKYLIPYNEKIWKFPTERMSLEWVERIPNPPVEDIVKSSLGVGTEGYTHQLDFCYPKTGGIQALIGSLQQKIDDHIVPNFEVKKVEKEDANWVISNGQEERSYDKIISTIPVHDLANALNAPEEIINAANNLKYNSLITVMIGLETSEINNLTWLYIPDKNVMTHRISFPSNYSPYAAPDGKSSVLAEITCNIGDEIWKMEDKAIIERVIDELCDIKMINKYDVCFSEVRRLKYAYVITDLDYQENASRINEYMQKVGIDLLGRFSEFKYLNMDGCIRSVLNYLAKDNTMMPDNFHNEKPYP